MDNKLIERLENLTGKKILLEDANNANVEVLKMAFKKVGLSVEKSIATFRAKGGGVEVEYVSRGVFSISTFEGISLATGATISFGIKDANKMLFTFYF